MLASEIVLEQVWAAIQRPSVGSAKEHHRRISPDSVAKYGLRWPCHGRPCAPPSSFAPESARARFRSPVRIACFEHQDEIGKGGGATKKVPPVLGCVVPGDHLARFRTRHLRQWGVSTLSRPLSTQTIAGLTITTKVPPRYGVEIREPLAPRIRPRDLRRGSESNLARPLGRQTTTSSTKRRELRRRAGLAQQCQGPAIDRTGAHVCKEYRLQPALRQLRKHRVTRRGQGRAGCKRPKRSEAVLRRQMRPACLLLQEVSTATRRPSIPIPINWTKILRPAPTGSSGGSPRLPPDR